MHPTNSNPRRPDCEAIAAILTDALDNSLSVEERAAFDRHIASCPDCANIVAEAQQGAAWLELLRSPKPQPSDDLMARIIAQTSGVQLTGLQPALAAGYELPFRQSFMVQLRSLGNVLLQPRLAMTAAMAFFSIALTLNITGVRVRDLNLNGLRPSNIQRSFSQANVRAIQFYDNLRVVNDMESRLQDAQQMNAQPAQPRPTAPTNDQDRPKQPATPNGSSYRETPAPASQKEVRA